MLDVVLFEPEIPYNAGAVGRTCVALGAKLWFVRPLGFRLDDRYCRRAGLDYWPHLNYEVVDHWDALTERLGRRRAWLFSKSAQREYTDVSYQHGDVFIFGCESRGLPPSLLSQHADRTLRIPIRSETRSLNLSVSVGIVTFEAQRQVRARDRTPPGEAERTRTS